MRPLPLSTLVARAFEELERTDSIYDLPRRNFVLQPKHHVTIHGRRVASPLGPAAGPHTQMAQNIAAAWLGGARVFELKTVQILDRLTIPRPCIDVRTVGYNVEWSQELTLDESRQEYVKASMLIEILAHLFRVEPASLFDLSVGYDLAGIRSERVTAFLRGMMDAGPTVDALRAGLEPQFATFDFTTNIASSVTLSTFHGCPPHEIERIADYLMSDLGLDCVIKLNPTLLGARDLLHLLHDVLGYDEVAVPPTAFANDPTFDQALDIAGRLQRRASQLGRNFGIKLTNTLVVENKSDFLPRSEALAYLSGPPLHVLAMHLVQRFRQAMPSLPISFSAGIDRVNYPDAVRLGLKPVTICTDLLKQGGYARLRGYHAELSRRMDEAHCFTIERFARGDVDSYVAQLDRDPRYRRERVERSAARKTGAALECFDCATCDLCIGACPNVANFRVPSFGALAKPHQIVTLADLCNDCGNCETFCPELGAPNRIKPRVWNAGVPPAGPEASRLREAIFNSSYVNFINAVALQDDCGGETPPRQPARTPAFRKELP